MKKNIPTIPILFTVAVLVIGTAFAQQGDQSGKQRKIEFKPTKQVDTTDTIPVTEAEARETFQHVMQSLPALAPKINVGTCTISDSTKPVTREEILLEMDRLHEAARPFFKLTPRPVYFDDKTITLPQGAARTSGEKLARRGFVATASVLLTEKNDTVTVADFGDDVGIFVARIADLTHMPDPKYSPALMDDGPP